MNLFFQTKVEDIILNINLVIKHTKLLENAQNELKEFVLKKKKKMKHQ